MGVTISVDVGEGRSGVPASLSALGVEIAIARLTAGDYVVGPGEIIERKTVADLHRSIATGRLWRQLEKLRTECDRAWLLIEGRRLDAGCLSATGVRGALVSVVDTGVPLVWSESSLDSAMWIHRVAVRVNAGKPSPSWRLRAPRRPRSPSPVSLLVGIPGISPAIAGRLLDRFGSIEGIVCASRADLMSIPGVGKRRSDALASLLSGTSREAGSAQTLPTTRGARTWR